MRIVQVIAKNAPVHSTGALFSDENISLATAKFCGE